MRPVGLEGLIRHLLESRDVLTTAEIADALELCGPDRQRVWRELDRLERRGEVGRIKVHGSSSVAWMLGRPR